MDEKKLLKFRIEIKAHRSDTEGDIRKKSHDAIEVLSKTAQIWKFDYKDDHFRFYPDENYETRGFHQFGLAVQLQRRVRRLKAIAYLQQVFESSCQLIMLIQARLKLDLTVDLE
ncbi:MAG: hypothetical protein B6I20_05425 [Bacteroidetes bacterium 4572_117]|nr:MAG: hypothetical protein B6I20_05425 [Bacteroidetes bacterium 4572_117]